MCFLDPIIQNIALLMNDPKGTIDATVHFTRVSIINAVKGVSHTPSISDLATPVNTSEGAV